MKLTLISAAVVGFAYGIPKPMWSSGLGSKKTLSSSISNLFKSEHQDWNSMLLDAMQCKALTGVLRDKKDPIKYLLDNGAKPNTKDKNDYTPLHWAAFYGRTQTILDFMSHFAPAGSAAESAAESIAESIAEDGKVGTHEYNSLKFDDSMPDVNAKNRNGDTPLHLASLKGLTRTVQALLEVHAKINAQNYQGETPLDSAVRAGKTETAAFLREKGAENGGIKKFDEAGWGSGPEPNEKATTHGSDASMYPPPICNPKGSTKLIDAIKDRQSGWMLKTRLERVKHRFAEKDDPNQADEDQMTPLHWASQLGYTDIVGFLLDHKAQTESKDVNGNTPLHLAVRERKTNTVLALLAKGADIEARTDFGDTPLILAILNRDTITVEALLGHEQKPKLGAKNYNDESPLDLVKKEGISSLLKELILKANRADKSQEDTISSV